MDLTILHPPTDAVHVDPVRFHRLPPSAQVVFEAVRDAGPLSATGLRDHTGLPARTVRYAVRRLKDEGLLDERCSLRDCRTCYFFVNQRCIGAAALQAAGEE